MSHLKGIGFENFGVFDKPVWFDFAPITILTGPNSSGKSSISKALNLFKHNSKLSTLDFDTPDHQLGTLDLVKNTTARNNKVTFYFPVELGEEFKNLRIKLEYEYFDKHKQTILTKFELYDTLNGNIFLSAVNPEPKAVNTKPNDTNDFPLNILIVDGEVNYTLFSDLYYYLYELGNDVKNIDGFYSSQTAFESLTAETYYNSYLTNKNSWANIRLQPMSVSSRSQSKHSLKYDPSNTYFRWFCLMSEKEITNHYHRKIARATKDLDLYKAQIRTKENCIRYYNEYLEITKRIKSDIEDIGGNVLSGVHIDDNYFEEDNIYRNYTHDLSMDEFIMYNLEVKTDRVTWLEQELKKNIQLRKKLLKELGIEKLTALIIEIERNTLSCHKTSLGFDKIFGGRDYKFDKKKWLFPKEKDLNPEKLKEEFTRNVNGRKYGTEFINPEFFNEVGNCIERRSEKFRSSLSNFVSDVTEYLIKEIEHTTINLNFIEAVRNNTQRFYAYSNTANSFNALIKEFQTINFDVFLEMFKSVIIDDFEIADDIEIKNVDEGFGSIVYLIKDGKKTNLADLGFGTIQLLPIIMQVFIVANKNYKRKNWQGFMFYPSTLIIEEPESNLHPKLQSALAEFFMEVYKQFNIQLIIETHSEYLIRKLQYLTAKKEIEPSDTVIYYLNSPKVVKETGAEQVIKIEIKKDGSLTNDFGTGFFDEALKWQLELMHLHNQN